MTNILMLFSQPRSIICVRAYTYVSAFSILLLSISIASNLTHAQEKAPPTQVQTTDYTRAESIGLLGAKDKGSFGNGMLHGTKRSELTTLLKHVKQNQWASMRPLIKNYLLTEADSTALIQDIPVTPGKDLLTLRLNALLRLGYNREAFELYRKASKNKLDEPTMRAGIYAMLLNQQKGLACLEAKTVSEEYKDKPLWNALNTYCEISVPNENATKKTGKDAFSDFPTLKSLTMPEDFGYAYTPNNFTALSMLERAALSAEKIMSTSYVTPETISKIPPEHISVLLSQPDINDMQKALLLGAAIDYAIEEPEVLSTYYIELFDQHNKKSKKNKESESSPKMATSSATEDLVSLANLYKETNNSLIGKERIEKLSQAREITKKHSNKLLIPFLPAISKLDMEEELSLEDTLSIAPLYIYAPDTISKKWIKKLLKADYSDKNQKNITREKLLIYLFLLRKDKDDALSNKVYKYISTASLRTSLTKDIKNIIENIDRYPTNDDKVRIKDTNGFDLDVDKGYTMPPYRVLNTLKQASDDQDISVSLLLSSRILSEVDRSSTYIGTLGDIASALNEVGIKTAPRRVIAQALMQVGN